MFARHLPTHLSLTCLSAGLCLPPSEHLQGVLRQGQGFGAAQVAESIDQAGLAGDLGGPLVGSPPRTPAKVEPCQNRRSTFIERPSTCDLHRRSPQGIPCTLLPKPTCSSRNMEQTPRLRFRLLPTLPTAHARRACVRE